MTVGEDCSMTAGQDYCMTVGEDDSMTVAEVVIDNDGSECTAEAEYVVLSPESQQAAEANRSR